MNFQDRYGPLDRFLHRVAFRAGLAQRMIADVEKAVHGDVLESITPQKPVFISALPRSGTTILLRLLAETGHFASHTYRDMPFVLCPMMWDRFSEPFAVDDAPRQRAHGDGLRVSADSPEAFEEMIWKHFWPDHYREDLIRPWADSDRNAEFGRFLDAHMRKIIALRRDGPGDERRYVSKNNLNIARLASPPAPLREGVFLIPFREPVQQAASMLRQHQRFLEIHEQDDFVREYMEAIGHHEFGKELKPVDFGGWLAEELDPETLEFWLLYWIAAYRYVLENAGPSMALLSYRRLTEDSEMVLREIAGIVGIPEDDLAVYANRLHPPRYHDVDLEALPATSVERARELQRRLERAAAV